LTVFVENTIFFTDRIAERDMKRMGIDSEKLGATYM